MVITWCITGKERSHSQTRCLHANPPRFLSPIMIWPRTFWITHKPSCKICWWGSYSGYKAKSQQPQRTFSYGISHCQNPNSNEWLLVSPKSSVRALIIETREPTGELLIFTHKSINISPPGSDYSSILMLQSDHVLLFSIILLVGYCWR